MWWWEGMDRGEVVLVTIVEIPWFDYAHHRRLRCAPLGMTDLGKLACVQAPDW